MPSAADAKHVADALKASFQESVASLTEDEEVRLKGSRVDIIKTGKVFECSIGRAINRIAMNIRTDRVLRKYLPVHRRSRSLGFQSVDP